MNNVTGQRLMNAYARSLRRYLAAERALADAPEPVPAELVGEYHQAAEDFLTIRGVFRASVKNSAALHAAEDYGTDPEGNDGD